MNESSGFEAQLKFFKGSDVYLHEKPYGFKDPPEHHPRTNIKIERIDDVYIKDIRGFEQSFTVNRNGFTVRNVDCDLSYEEYHDAEKIQPYFRVLEELLQNLLGASRVEVFRHAIRKRHSAWPIAKEPVYKFDQPTTTVHIDATTDGLFQEIEMKHGAENAKKLCQGRVQWFNVWKPLRTATRGLNDWPLLICDSETVDKNKDLVAADLIYPMYATENTQVYYRPEYIWYYLSDHQANEVIIFKQADTEEDSCAGVPHCSVFNPLASADEPLRESIEARFLVYHEVP